MTFKMTKEQQQKEQQEMSFEKEFYCIVGA